MLLAKILCKLGNSSLELVFDEDLDGKWNEKLENKFYEPGL